MERPLDIARDGDLFPRQELLERVAGADWRDRRVAPWSWLAVAIGLVLVLAGLPEQHQLVRGPTTFAAEAPELAAHPLHLAARALGHAGLGIEAAWFGLSALATGALFLAVGLALRAFGMVGRLAFVTALLAVACPTVVANGRLPTPYVVGAALSALLLAAVAAPSDGAPGGRDQGARGARGYGLRIGLLWFVGTLLCHDLFALLPALVFAALQRYPRRRWAALAPLLALGALAAAVLVRAWTGPSAALRSVAFEGASTGVTEIACAFGLGALALRGGRRAEEEQGPPRWLLVWVTSALALALVAGAPHGWVPLAVPPPTFLVPALAVLVGDTLARPARASDAALLAGLGLAVHLVIGGVWASMDGPSPSPFADARVDARAGDVLLWERPLDGADAYLLRRRVGLPLVGAGDGGAALEGATRVLTLDAAAGADPRATHTLDPRTGRIEPLTR